MATDLANLLQGCPFWDTLKDAQRGAADNDLGRNISAVLQVACMAKVAAEAARLQQGEREVVYAATALVARTKALRATSAERESRLRTAHDDRLKRHAEARRALEEMVARADHHNAEALLPAAGRGGRALPP